MVPYCTQDTHIGAQEVNFTDDGIAVNFNGAANVASVMAWLFANAASPGVVALVGCSAGAGLQIQAAHVADHYGNRTRVVAVGDSPSTLLTNAFVRGGLRNWGAECAFAAATGLPFDVRGLVPAFGHMEMCSHIPVHLCSAAYTDVTCVIASM
jgi:hypothetical protein